LQRRRREISLTVMMIAGVILFTVPAGSRAQAVAPPASAPTVTPTPASTPDAEIAADREPTPNPEPPQEFDLNPYPESAKEPAMQKWRTFKEAARGLLVWDFFDGRLTVRAHARTQVDGTMARANSLLEQTTGPLGESINLRRLGAFAQGTIDHRLR